MKNVYYSALALLFSVFCSAQKSGEINVNNLRVGFAKNGGLYQTDSAWGEFNIDDSPGTIPVFAGSLWMGGYINGQLRTAAETYYVSADPNYPTTDYQPGPVSDNYQDTSFINRYHRVWTLTRQQIKDHRENYTAQNYLIPPAIAEWPAHGDTTRGEAFHLAPFRDWNGNGIYEPELGDFPEIRGDQAVYIMFNDDDRHNPETSFADLNLEIHLMAYAFADLQNNATRNTVFMHYKVINRGNSPIDSFTVANWTDYDLGNFLDDIVGTSEGLKLSYCYNADDDDDGPMGFGLYPPAMGQLFLTPAAAGSGYYTNSSFPGNNQLTDPVSDLEFYRIMNQKWKNGNPLVIESPSGLNSTSNGDGYVPGSSLNDRTRWAFNEDVNWFCNPTMSSSDLRSITSLPQVTLPAGGDFCFDLATIYARDSSMTSAYSSVTKLKGLVAPVQQFFNAQGFVCMNNNIGLGEIDRPTISVFPNPAHNRLFIESEIPVQKATLISISGQISQEITAQGAFTQVNLAPNLKPGLYILQLYFENGQFLNKKIRIQ